MDMSEYLGPAKRDDEHNARRWRGRLFGSLRSSFMWKDGHSYKRVELPRSVTFPICFFCAHVIWDWPHFEEPVPENAVCEKCAQEEKEAEERDWP
jgi:hypothetical protein